MDVERRWKIFSEHSGVLRDCSLICVIVMTNAYWNVTVVYKNTKSLEKLLF